MAQSAKSVSQAGSALDIEAHVSGHISGQVAIGNNINQHFFKYEITPHGSIVNILTPEQEPRVTAKPSPIRKYPRPFHGLLGRETEIKQSIAALELLQTIELYGSAGVGKSVLLRYLAHHPAVNSLQHFPDGLVYYRLYPQQPVEDVQQMLFEAFYESDRSFKPSVNRIQQDLHNKRALVVLDNAKLSREDIEKLWTTAPHCVFAFTSTERNLWGEGQSILLQGLSVEASVCLVQKELGLSLEPKERTAAECLCTALNGHPLEILQQIARVHEKTELLAEVARRVQSATSLEARIRQLLCSLNQHQHYVLAALAALGGVALLTQQVSAIADIPDAKPVLESLQAINFVQLEDSHYSLSTNLLEPLQQQRNLTPYLKRAVSYFTTWSQQQTVPESLLEESEAISYLLRWAVGAGQWSDVRSLGRPFESALALKGHWGLRKQVLHWYLQAAENLGDQTAKAWALHQLGTHELCVGNTTAASKLLTQALQLRESLGDKSGADLTRHNLELPFSQPIPVQLTPPPVSPIPPPVQHPWLNSLRGMLFPALVTAGFAGLSSLLIVPMFTPSQPVSTTPSQTPSPTPAPTPTLDPSIPSCVAANVQEYLNIRSEPNGSAKSIGRLTAGEQTSTTGMRLRDFIEVSNPVNGWVNRKFTQRCISKPDRRETSTPTPTPTPTLDPSIPRETSTPTPTPTPTLDPSIPRETSTPTPTPTPTLDPSPLPTSKPPEQKPEQSSVCTQPPTSRVVNGLRLTIVKTETVNKVLRIHVKVDNQNPEDQDLTDFFSQLYFQDNLGKIYGYERWGIRIPGSGFTTSEMTLTEPIQPNASSISLNFGDVGGKKLCISGIPVK